MRFVRVCSNAHLNSKFVFRGSLRVPASNDSRYVNAVRSYANHFIRRRENASSFPLIIYLVMCDQSVSPIFNYRHINRFLIIAIRFVFISCVLIQYTYNCLNQSIVVSSKAELIDYYHFKHCCRQNKVNLLLSFLQYCYKQKSDNYNGMFAVNNYV